MKLRFFNAALPRQCAFAPWLCAFVFLLMCGCKTTTRIESHVEIKYTPLGNTFSFVGKKDASPFFAADIVKALKRAKVPPETEIRVNMGKFDNHQLIADIAARLVNGGYIHYSFCTAEIADSYTTTPGAERANIPPVVQPRVTIKPTASRPASQGR